MVIFKTAKIRLKSMFIKHYVRPHGIIFLLNLWPCIQNLGLKNILIPI